MAIAKQDALEGHNHSTFDDDAWAIVQAALSNPRWDFRTVEGLAKETGLSADEVRSTLQRHPDAVRRAYVPDRQGRPLYAPATRSVGWRELLATARAFVSKSL